MYGPVQRVKTAPLMPNKSADTPVAITAMAEKMYAYFMAVVDIDATTLRSVDVV